MNDIVHLQETGESQSVARKAHLYRVCAPREKRALRKIPTVPNTVTGLTTVTRSDKS
jgi:hypothetical protein